MAEFIPLKSLLREIGNLFMDVAWWVLLLAMVFVYAAPSFLFLFMSSWADVGLRDPFLTYATDGASLALGSGIYMTNHPGTPLHELYALLTKLLQWGLGFARASGLPFNASEMREWIIHFPQTFVFVFRFIAPISYVVFLLSIPLL